MDSGRFLSNSKWLVTLSWKFQIGIAKEQSSRAKPDKLQLAVSNQPLHTSVQRFVGLSRKVSKSVHFAVRKVLLKEQTLRGRPSPDLSLCKQRYKFLILIKF